LAHTVNQKTTTTTTVALAVVFMGGIILKKKRRRRGFGKGTYSPLAVGNSMEVNGGGEGRRRGR